MNREEYLLKKREEYQQVARAHSLKFSISPSSARIEPFAMADNLYYVGDKKVCIHLLDTGDGLILFDSGYPVAMHLLMDSIWRAGFDPKDVKWILHTHGHYDHFGASEEFRNMFGTRLAISRVDAENLREYPARAEIDEEKYPFVRIPEFDYELEDGEIFTLGNCKIRCVLTPGHMRGVMSFFFDVTYNGNTYLAGLFGGAGVNALTLPYMFKNKYEFDMPMQMLSSVDAVMEEPVMLHLGNHPANNATLQKREKQLAEGGNPFIDENSWKDFLTEQKKKVYAIIEKNKEMEEEIAKM